MKKLLIGVLSFSFLLVGCQQEAGKKEEAKETTENESLLIEYKKELETEDDDKQSFEFSFELPDEYTKMLVKERTFKANKLQKEDVLYEEELNKKADTFIVDCQLENNEISVFAGFPTSTGNMGSVGTTHQFSSIISYNANEKSVSEPKMDLFAIRWREDKEGADTLDSAGLIFDKTFNPEKMMKKDETIVIWSCEFVK